MEQFDMEQLKAFADALSQPAFAVRDGLVFYANSAFSVFQVGIGTPLSDFFCAGEPLSTAEDFDCTVAGMVCKARMLPQQNTVLYLLRPQEQTVSVHALSHAVNSIRASLHGVYNTAAALCEKLESAEDEQTQTQTAGLLQEVYRMEHTVQNMELLQQLLCGSYALKPQQTDIVNWLSGLFSHADDLLRYADLHLISELPEKLFNGNLDTDLVQLVYWNALANAAADAADGCVTVKAAHRDKYLQLTFISAGNLTPAAQRRLFSRYQVPIEEDPGAGGAGFGLPLIRQAVELHGGTILFAQKPQGELAFTVTFDLTSPAAASVSSPMPILRGLDPGLVHLSPVLPRSAYDSRDIL